MECFNWLDCITENQINSNNAIFCYLLIPPEFTFAYGGESIKKINPFEFDKFGIYNIYDLLAVWNQFSISEDNLIMPTFDQYKNHSDYLTAQDQYAINRRRLYDFKLMSEGLMLRDWGPCYKLDIGKSISEGPGQNEKLKYPLKVTTLPNMMYAGCKASSYDPDKGKFSITRFAYELYKSDWLDQKDISILNFYELRRDLQKKNKQIYDENSKMNLEKFIRINGGIRRDMYLSYSNFLERKYLDIETMKNLFINANLDCLIPNYLKDMETETDLTSLSEER